MVVETRLKGNLRFAVYTVDVESMVFPLLPTVSKLSILCLIVIAIFFAFFAYNFVLPVKRKIEETEVLVIPFETDMML